MADVFLSYKRAERARIQRIAELLRLEGLDVWYDSRLEIGRSEGFDEEIEREVTSAACVVVCWTPEAVRSIYVRAESKKGLERNVLIPVFLESCTLPVPFNAIDTAELIGWTTSADDPRWSSLVTAIKHTVERSRADEAQRIADSKAAYARLTERVFPGSLRAIVGRIHARHDKDAWDFDDDIEAVLQWLAATFEKEATLNAHGYELAERQAGGSAWRWWDDGSAARRHERLAVLRAILKRSDDAMWSSQQVLGQPAP